MYACMFAPISLYACYFARMQVCLCTHISGSFPCISTRKFACDLTSSLRWLVSEDDGCFGECDHACVRTHARVYFSLDVLYFDTRRWVHLFGLGNASITRAHSTGTRTYMSILRPPDPTIDLIIVIHMAEKVAV